LHARAEAVDLTGVTFPTAKWYYPAVRSEMTTKKAGIAALFSGNEKA
jgi:hypothetical protein